MVLIFALFSYLNISLNDTKLLNVADASGENLLIEIENENLDENSDLRIGLNNVNDGEGQAATWFTGIYDTENKVWDVYIKNSEWNHTEGDKVVLSMESSAGEGYEWAHVDYSTGKRRIISRFGEGITKHVVYSTDGDYFDFVENVYEFYCYINIVAVEITSVTTYQIEYFDAGASSAISINDECWGGTRPPTEHKTDADTTLILPTKTGYTFDGWYTTSTCTGTKLSKLSASGYTADIKLWGKWVANYERVKINVSIVGVYEYGVVLYLVENNKVQNQIVAKNGESVKLEQKVGQAYAILVSKPYMWTMSVSGDCALDANNKNKITYTVLTAGNEMTLTLSGGAQSSMVVI